MLKSLLRGLAFLIVFAAVAPATAVGIRHDVTAVRSLSASPDASPDRNTAAINAALAKGGTVTITSPGVYRVGASRYVDFNGNRYALCLVIPSDTHLILGDNVVLQAAAGLTNPVLLQNSDTAHGNRNIVLEGGRWDGNAGNVTRVDGTAQVANMIWFSNAMNITLSRMVLADSVGYHSLFSQVSQLRATDIVVRDTVATTNQDGIHIQGASSNVILRNISGNPRDDLIAVMTWDTSRANRESLGSGPISDVLIDGVIGDDAGGAWHLVRLADFSNYGMSNVTVRNLSGKYLDGGVTITGTNPVFDGITFDGVKCEPLPGVAPGLALIDLQDGGGSFVFNDITRHFRDGVETNGKLPAVHIHHGGTYRSIQISHAHFYDHTSAGGTLGFITTGPNTTVSMQLDDVTAKADVAGTAGGVVFNAGTIDRLQIGNVATANVGRLFYTTGSVLRGVWIDNYAGSDNGHAFFETDAAVRLPVVGMANVRLDGRQGGPEGCVRIAGLAGAVLFQIGQSSCDNGVDPSFTRAGDESIRVQSTDMPVPRTVLTPLRGDMILDSTRHDDPYRYNGKKWKHL